MRGIGARDDIALRRFLAEIAHAILELAQIDELIEGNVGEPADDVLRALTTIANLERVSYAALRGCSVRCLASRYCFTPVYAQYSPVAISAMPPANRPAKAA